jgi:HAD superfamily hydrolase (TIGR01450 family)
MIPAVPAIAMGRLLAAYRGILLDAYGVLITHDGAMPGAAALVERLHATNVAYLVLTNDASRSPRASADRYREMGLPIPADRIITSGSLLRPYLEENGLRGARCVVLGTGDSVRYVEDAGGIVVPTEPDADAQCLIVCDERGYPLRESLDAAITLLYRRIDCGQPVRLILPNPDLVYPAGEGRFGFTAGAVAVLLEAGLRRRYPHREDLRFERLGKPHPLIFEEAMRRLGTRNVILVGDQLDTDIRGAAECGIDSALALTGITPRDALGHAGAVLPTYVLASLDPNETETTP